MFIRLLKAIAELVVVSVKLVYVFVFYPNTPNTKIAKKIIDPVYDEHIYSSGESDISDEALKDEWIQGNIVTKETDYTFDPIVVESTKKILNES